MSVVRDVTEAPDFDFVAGQDVPPGVVVEPPPPPPPPAPPVITRRGAKAIAKEGPAFLSQLLVNNLAEWRRDTYGLDVQFCRFLMTDAFMALVIMGEERETCELLEEAVLQWLPLALCCSTARKKYESSFFGPQKRPKEDKVAEEAAATSATPGVGFYNELDEGDYYDEDEDADPNQSRSESWKPFYTQLSGFSHTRQNCRDHYYLFRSIRERINEIARREGGIWLAMVHTEDLYEMAKVDPQWVIDGVYHVPRVAARVGFTSDKAAEQARSMADQFIDI